jgi:hypothetical protein
MSQFKSPGISLKLTNSNDITEILLKVALNTIKVNRDVTILSYNFWERSGCDRMVL